MLYIVYNRLRNGITRISTTNGQLKIYFSALPNTCPCAAEQRYPCIWIISKPEITHLPGSATHSPLAYYTPTAQSMSNWNLFTKLSVWPSWNEVGKTTVQKCGKHSEFARILLDPRTRSACLPHSARTALASPRYLQQFSRASPSLTWTFLFSLNGMSPWNDISGAFASFPVHRYSRAYIFLSTQAFMYHTLWRYFIDADVLLHSSVYNLSNWTH